MTNLSSVEKPTANRAVDPAGEFSQSANGWFAGIALTKTWQNVSIPTTMLQMSE